MQHDKDHLVSNNKEGFLFLKMSIYVFHERVGSDGCHHVHVFIVHLSFSFLVSLFEKWPIEKKLSIQNIESCWTD